MQVYLNPLLTAVAPPLLHACPLFTEADAKGETPKINKAAQSPMLYFGACFIGKASLNIPLIYRSARQA
jgi:hypothetical protein